MPLLVCIFVNLQRAVSPNTCNRTISWMAWNKVPRVFTKLARNPIESIEIAENKHNILYEKLPTSTDSFDFWFKKPCHQSPEGWMHVLDSAVASQQRS